MNRGQITSWFVAGADLEDRNRAEQLQANLTHASRVSTMGEMLSSISHELAECRRCNTRRGASGKGAGFQKVFRVVMMMDSFLLSSASERNRISARKYSI
jgi:hypothetical protein